MRVVVLASGLGAFRGLAKEHVSLVVRDVPTPPFETMGQCTEAYNFCMGNQVTTEPEYAPTTTEAPTTTTSTTTAVPTTPRPPMRHGDVGDLDHTDAKMGYKPPSSADGEPAWDYNEHGDDWAGDCNADGQSPVDIVKYVDLGGQTKSVLWFDYYLDDRVTTATEADLVNAGHGLHYDAGAVDLGFVKIGRDEYEAKEYTFRTPSEHTIDGQVFPLEIQVMHTDAAGHQLGVSVLFKYGASNAFLAAINEAVPVLPQWTVEHGGNASHLTGAHPGVFNLEAILPMGEVHPGGDMTFYNYQGSLTHPPCTGGVSWWVSAEPVEASKDEIKTFRAAVMGSASTTHGNNRATHPLDGRKVLVGHTGFQHHMQQHGHRKDTKPDSRGYNSQDTPWKAA